MIAQATNFVVQSILRRASINDDTKLNIITFCTHERYEQALAKTGHNFYSLKIGKTWDSDYGVQPENYHQVSYLMDHVDYDLVLCQDGGRIKQAQEIAAMYNIPIIYHCHVLPDIRQDIERQTALNNSIFANQYSFISEYNKNQWRKDGENVHVIHHGIDFDFWNDCKAEKGGKVISVANLFPERDWCLGWNLWCETVGFKPDDQGYTADFPLELVGKNPPYSNPATSLQALRKKYHESLIFFNSSIHSPVPMSLMEAMACGCCVISTETCMIPEIIEDGVNGFLSNDPEVLRFKIKEMLENPEEAKRIGENAKETIKNRFGIDKFVDSWNKMLYRSVKEYESVLL